MAFLVAADCIDQGRCWLEGDDARHLIQVLRAREGTQVELLSSDDRRCDALVTRIEGQRVELRILRTRVQQLESPLDIRMACALTKGQQLFDNARMFTELGCTALLPFVSDHAVVRPDAAAFEQRRQRLERIVQESCKQCRRTRPPQVAPLAEYAELVHRAQDDAVQMVLFHECATQPVAEVPLDRRRPVLVFCGPEGGFSDAEVDRAEQSGAWVVSLGPRVLRAGTAQLAGLCALQHRFGDLG